MLSIARLGQSPDWADAVRLAPPGEGERSVVLSVRIDDVDRPFQRAKQFGAWIVHEPETYNFGERQYTAEDVAGYRWVFSQSVTGVAPEEWGARR